MTVKETRASRRPRQSLGRVLVAVSFDGWTVRQQLLLLDDPDEPGHLRVIVPGLRFNGKSERCARWPSAIWMEMRTEAVAAWRRYENHGIDS